MKINLKELRELLIMNSIENISEDDVKHTNDYDLFKLGIGTRIPNTFCTIGKNDVIAPIIVDQDYNIIDGLHRFLGLKEANLNVPYIMINTK